MKRTAKELLDELIEAVSDLEQENQKLRDQVAWLTHKQQPVSIPTEGVDDYLRYAIEHMQQHKWKEAAYLVAKQYGPNFMIKEDLAFRSLKDAMYGHLNMPEAPARADKSHQANLARERRKAIRATVYTYIDRMGEYWSKFNEI